ncbi:MAG: ion transporter [Bacteroidota bacterium]
MLRKDKLYEIIFEADTREGRLFDVALIFLILFSIALVMLDSIQGISGKYHQLLRIAEWIVTLTFTIEYILRIYIVQKPWRYITSFYGIVDLLAIIPTYMGLFVVGGQSLIVIRAIRLLRVFRILKLTRYTRAGRFLVMAMIRSREKIFIFLFFVLTLVIIFGTIMYIVEGPEHGFTSIPTSIYWAIVTLTTVGYGDISPSTGLGQFLASLIMIIGYAIIAVPTGIVTSEMLSARIHANTQVCSNCLHDRHDDDALFCKKCGHPLHLNHQNGNGSTSGQVSPSGDPYQ